MASYEKRSNGSWRAKVRRAGISKSATFPTKKEAQAWAVEQESEAGRVKHGGFPKKTICEMLIRYAEDVSPAKRGSRWELVRIKSWAGKGKSAEAALPFLDDLVVDVSQVDIAAWRDKRLSQVSPASVIREMGLLASIFSVARKEWKWLHESPMKDVARPTQPEHRRRRILDEEIDALCVALGFDGGTADTLTCQVAVAFLLAIETAMRQGEILGLTWDNVFLDRKIAHLPRTKNGSARNVPLSSRAIELIRLLPEREDKRLFGVTSASCDALFRKAKGRARIDGLHFHDTRREATSRLSKKVDVLTLAKITGHKDIRMLMVYYEEDMSSVAERLG